MVDVLGAERSLALSVLTYRFPLVQTGPEAGLYHHGRSHAVVGMAVARSIAQHNAGAVRTDELDNALLAIEIVH